MAAQDSDSEAILAFLLQKDTSAQAIAEPELDLSAGPARPKTPKAKPRPAKAAPAPAAEPVEVTDLAAELRTRCPQWDEERVQRGVRGWTDAGFAPAEVHAWCAAGLPADQWLAAAALCGEGWGPEVMAVRLDGIRVKELLRGGQSHDAVVAHLRVTSPRENPTSRRSA